MNEKVYHLANFYHQRKIIEPIFLDDAGEVLAERRIRSSSLGSPAFLKFPLTKNLVAACITGVALLHQTATVGGTSELVRIPVSHALVPAGTQEGICLVKVEYGVCQIPPIIPNPWLEVHIARPRKCVIIDRNGLVNYKGTYRCVVEGLKHQ